MRAVVCREYGTPEDLVLDELPDPTPGPGQVVVKVRAAAVNYPDVLLIAGKYQIKVPPPFSPGSEMAGDVLAVGDGRGLPARRPGVGDHVRRRVRRAGGGGRPRTDADSGRRGLRRCRRVRGDQPHGVLHAADGGSGQARRLGGGARGRRRCRPGGGGYRSAHGRQGDCRGLRCREARGVPSARGGGRHRLRPRGSARRGSRRSPDRTARRWSSTRSAAATPSRRCAGWAAAGSSSRSAMPPATSRPSR